MLAAADDSDSLRTIIIDTIGVLCRNSLKYNHELKIQGLLGISLDSSRVLLVSVDELYTRATQGRIAVSTEQTTEDCRTATNTKPHQNECRSLTQSCSQHGEDYRRQQRPCGGPLPCNSGSLSHLPSATSTAPQRLSGGAVPDQENCTTTVEQTTSQHSSKTRVKRCADVISLSDSDSESETDLKPDIASLMKPPAKRINMCADWNFGRNTGETNDPDEIHSVNGVKPVVCVENVWSNVQRLQSLDSQPGGNGVDYPALITALSRPIRSRSHSQSRKIHACDYDGCDKHFAHRRHLLRHQTEKHGRLPVRVRNAYHMQDFGYDQHCFEGFPADDSTYYSVGLPLAVSAVNEFVMDVARSTVRASSFNGVNSPELPLCVSTLNERPSLLLNRPLPTPVAAVNDDEMDKK